MKSIFKAVAVVTIFSIITRTLGFFFRVFLSRKLGAEGLGIFQMASSILGLFLTLVSSGIPLATAKQVSKYLSSNDYAKKYKTVSSALIIAIVVSVIASFIIFALKSFWNIVLTDSRAVEILIILIPSVLTSAVYSVFRGALWGHSDYFNCGLTELIEQIIRFALTFIFLLNITDMFVAAKYSAIAFNITCLFSAVIVMFIYFKRGRLNFKIGEYKNIFKSALPVTGIRVANSFVQPLTTLIIPNMLVVCGYAANEAISSFGVVMGMTFPMLFVPMSVVGSISMVLIPSISSLMSKNNFLEIKNNITSSIEVSIFISMIFIPLYLSVGDLIGIVLYNNALSGVLLQTAAIAVLPITLCNLTGSILDALNKEIKSFINHMIGSIILFASLIIFTPLLGINSVIISFFLSMTTTSILNFRIIKKAVPNFNFNLISYSFKYTLILIPASTLGMFISNICLQIANNFISAVIGGGIAIIATLILIRIFNIYDMSELIEIIKHRKRKPKTE